MGSLLYRTNRFILGVVLLSMVSASHAESFMYVDELRPGMRGTGITVFSGREISQFEVEILGILKNVYPKGDMILARLRNELLDKTGLIAGMSGSPVYIDGKLIGAVAYGWGFTKETIAGITPIKEMLTLLELDDDTEIKPTTWHGRQFSHKLSQPFSVGRHRYEKIIVNTIDKAPLEYSPSVIVLHAIATPIMVGGFNPQILNKMEPVFRRFGLMPVQTGGSSEDSPSEDLVPGAVIGAQVLSGDCELTALGTVTYSHDGKILAFGHPFLAGGEVDFPMTGGSVLAIVPSQLFSFKLSSSGAVLGKIARDTQSAISGQTGIYARLIPSRIQINTVDTKKEFNYQMIHDEFWSPNLLNWCVMNSIFAAGTSLGNSARVKMRIQLEDSREPIVFENVFSKLFPVESTNAFIWQQEFSKLLNQIMANEFQQVQVEDIDIEIELTDTPLTAYIEGIRVSKAEVKPGEDVHVTIILKPYGSKRETLKTTVTIPEDLPDGQIKLVVCDAQSSMQTAAALNPEKYIPRTLERLLENLQEIEKNNEVAVRLLLPHVGVTVHGQELPSLPSSLINIMSSSRETGVGKLAEEICERIPTSWVVSGRHEFELTVKSK